VPAGSVVLTSPVLIDPSIEFFLIRHGETAWNREGRLQGQRDVPLNPLGRDQASSAGRSLKRLLAERGVADPGSFGYVASPLGRCRETMELARSAIGLEAKAYRTEDLLRELSFGAWEGLTWAEVKAVAPGLARERKRNKWAFVPPGGESYEGLGKRLRPWLPKIRHHDVVVAHGGVARVLTHLLAGVAREEAPDLEIWQGRVLCFGQGRFSWHG
jgi:broad specificity phosphatase PhoE